jgi:hypothetical protein
VTLHRRRNFGGRRGERRHHRLDVVDVGRHGDRVAAVVRRVTPLPEHLRHTGTGS